MKTACSLLAIGFALTATTLLAGDPPDLRAELPRDVRVILLGVPSVENVRATEENVRHAIQALDNELSKESVEPNKIEQAKARLFFRLGQFDEAIAALTKSLHDQERVKGLEAYRDLARALQLHSESLANLSGTSEAPLVQEDDTPSPASAASNPRDLVKQLKSELKELDDLLRRIEQKSKPDADRKAQLEKEVGTLGQFVFQMRSLAEDIKAAEAGQKDLRVDSGEIVRGVQGLIDAIRDIKREKEQKATTGEQEPPARKPLKRERVRL